MEGGRVLIYVFLCISWTVGGAPRARECVQLLWINKVKFKVKFSDDVMMIDMSHASGQTFLLHLLFASVSQAAS